MLGSRLASVFGVNLDLRKGTRWAVSACADRLRFEYNQDIIDQIDEVFAAVDMRLPAPLQAYRGTRLPPRSPPRSWRATSTVTSSHRPMSRSLRTTHSASGSDLARREAHGPFTSLVSASAFMPDRLRLGHRHESAAEAQSLHRHQAR
jgi:hypothetical protein